ncbi:hypothetical protein SPLC1_S208520 [Arthrospira platensis C1]|nr:hypothetical protein SPLC1_S208520 [Arthrospira platensis C1]
MGGSDRLFEEIGESNPTNSPSGDGNHLHKSPRFC